MKRLTGYNSFGSVYGINMREGDNTDTINAILKRLTCAVPEETKINIDAKYNFDKDNKALIKAFAKIDVALRDENGDFRNTYDVLKDMNEKYEQLYK